jgi:hypothetical protein
MPGHHSEAEGDWRSRRRGRISRSRSYILLRAILPIYQNTWVINLQLLLLRQVIHNLPGPSSHYHHHCHLLTLEASSQKGTSTPNSSATSGRVPKLVQSITLYQNRSIYTKEYPTSDVPLSFMPFYSFYEKQVMKNLISNSCNNCARIRVRYISWTSEARNTFLRKRSKFWSTKVVPKGMQSQKLWFKDTKFVPKGAQCKFSAQKSFLKEYKAKYHRNVRWKSSKVVPKGMQSLNATEIEGEEAQMSFLRGCRA